MKANLISLLLLLLPALAGASASRPVVGHALEVTLEPDRHRLSVRDRVTLPAAVVEVLFTLHAGLEPALEQGKEARLESLGRAGGTPVPAERWRIRFRQPQHSFTLRYGGVIHHPTRGTGRRAGTAGTIGSRGVFLAASSLWFPSIGGRFLRFSLRVRLPPGWRAVSQGRPGDDGSWHIDHPQDDIYLVAGPYRLFQQRTPRVLAQIYLHRPDDALARRYLRATDDYLALYDRLIGPYPYTKFALVENFWESGYGMPSFTLLGPRVIRLPFILRSSYPHEILHNWWGNGVYVDYGGGNWSEGLTTYLSDHLFQEQLGRGAAYRRDTLQRYASYVKEERDFPLTDFRGNHGEVSQAVGYGRMLMFLHMLRLRLGDDRFVRGLRRFYADNRFRIAGFDDLKRAFEAVSGEDLDGEFDTWTTRTGAPALAVEGLKVAREGDGYRLGGSLRQIQRDPPFPLRVPLYVQVEGEQPAHLRWVRMTGREQDFEFRFGSRPLRLAVDPLFDLFRRLAPGEVPSSLGQLFGSDRLTLVLPARAADETVQAWRELAQQWGRRYPGLRLVRDDALERLPDGGVWILGRENRFSDRLWREVFPPDLMLEHGWVRIGGAAFERAGSSLAVTGRDGPRVLGYLEASSPAAIRRLARKLPHYNKYSYLLFQGDEAANRVKGQWRTTGSPLVVTLTGGDDLPPLEIPDHRPLVPAEKEAGTAVTPRSRR